MMAQPSGGFLKLGLQGPFFLLFTCCFKGLGAKKQHIGDTLELVGSVLQRLESAIRPVLEGSGYELVLLEYIPRGRILRLYVDREAGITLDDCSTVSHLVGDLLDAEGLVDGPGGISGHYTLEVSSPGLDRPLVRPQDFMRFAGRLVNVATRESFVDPMNPMGRKKFHGTLVSADETVITVEVDGRAYTISYGVIDKARLVPEF